MNDPAALITGAGRGLGRALALALHRQGYRLVLVARTRAELDGTAAQIRDEGGEAHVIVADIGDSQQIPRIAAVTSDAVGDLRLLVHNASALGPLPMPLLADTEPAALERVFDVNVFGPFRLTRALVGGMLLGAGGVVVQLSSDAAVEAYPGWGAYAASKAAGDHLTRTWAAELAEAGVRFFAVDPGEMNTAMHAAALPDADPATLSNPSDVAASIIAMVDAGVGGGQRLVAAGWEGGA